MLCSFCLVPFEQQLTFQTTDYQPKLGVFTNTYFEFESQIETKQLKGHVESLIANFPSIEFLLQSYISKIRLIPDEPCQGYYHQQQQKQPYCIQVVQL